MSDKPSSLASAWRWVRQQLRIDAVRDVFSLVEVQSTEIIGLIALAVIFAFTEGVGLSVLLPVLQYAENGAVVPGGGVLWEWPARLAVALGVPLNLVTLLVLAFIPVLLRQVTYFFNAWYSAVVSSRIAVRMRVDTYSKMVAADPDFLSSRSQGEFTGIVLGQTGVAGQAVLQVIRLLSVLLQMSIYAIMLMVLSLPLTLVAAIAGLIVSQLMRRNMRRTRELGSEIANVTQNAYSAIVERIALARLVKMRSEENAEIANVREFSHRLATAGVAMGKIAAWVEVTADPLLMLSAFLTLYLGIAVYGLKLAELGMLLYVLTRFNGKVKEFNGVRQSISSLIAGLLLVRDMSSQALASTTISDGPLPFEGVRESIAIENAYFAFPESETPVLRGVSAEIPAGSFTAIVGRSGAGKSTLVELLPRMRDTTSGRVLYDGIDVRQFSVNTLRRGIGYLTQDPMLFNDTLRFNLLYGVRHDVSEAHINKTLDLANAAFVRDLPEGLETRLGDRGIRLSGGERQRIALARVLLENPSVLILDEPTSALDSESERYIQETLASLHGFTTIIVIAHRLATVVAADQLLVIEDGRIVQRGRHADLAATDGPYKHLFESQLLTP